MPNDASNTILLLTTRWTETPMVDTRKEPLCVVRPDLAGGWSLLLVFPKEKGPPFAMNCPVRPGEPDGDPIMQGDRVVGFTMRRWGLRRLGPGVWALDPSIHEHNVLHAYVVLCDVPDPAPWEVKETRS